jgi:uncharacterized protein (TIGR03086 family)
MSEVSERYRAIADGFTRRVEGVPDDAWKAPTPCPDWTVADLVVHVVTTHHRVMSMLDGNEPVEADSSDALLSQWCLASGHILDALADGQRAAKVVGGMAGEQPWETLVGRLVCSDTLIHTWDLARATQQDEKLEPNAVAKAFEALTPLDEAIRRPGGFAPRITSEPDVDRQTEFLNFCGRSV